MGAGGICLDVHKGFHGYHAQNGGQEGAAVVWCRHARGVTGWSGDNICSGQRVQTV